jgi:hypothetical protein
MGGQRRPIYLDSRDRQRFYEVLGQVAWDFGLGAESAEPSVRSSRNAECKDVTPMFVFLIFQAINFPQWSVKATNFQFVTNTVPFNAN